MTTTRAEHQRRTLRVLRFAQVPGQAAVAGVVAVGALLAKDLLHSLEGWPAYGVLLVVFVLAQLFTEALSNGTTSERQGAFATVANVPGAAADASDPQTYLPRLLEAAGYQTWHKISPPTPSCRARSPVITPFGVERIATPIPERTHGISRLPA